MTQRLLPEDLGKPALQVAGFQLWIHGREFPDAGDYDDGNWLRVTAHCGASGASVWAQGAILMVTDIERFGGQCQSLLQEASTAATLEPLGPELRVTVESVDRLGHLRARVEITPDHLVQAHSMEFDIDQSYLSGIIKECSAIVQEYPVRGQSDRQGV